MATIEHAYRYAGGSTVGPGGELLLATSGGVVDDRPVAHPYFYDGFLDHPEQAAVALLAVAKVARSRYFLPAASIRLLDPVVTSNGDRLRFESFSSCCGVYARYDVALDAPALACGTTNVDMNPPMRDALAGVGGGEPVHLRVGADEVTVRTLDAMATERKVALPERWLKGFGEVQVAAAGMSPRAELSAVEARRFLRGLPRDARGPLWAVPAGRGLRLSPRPAPGAACLSGPERLRVLDPLLRFATGLRAYGADGLDGFSPTASAWELACADARFTVVLSPEASRGFSGEGGVLTDLAGVPPEDADLVAVLLGWEPRVDLDRLAAAAGMPAARAAAALTRLGVAGRVGYDLAEGGYFHRELPYDPAALAALHPRLPAARALLEAGAVTVTGNGARVRSGDVEHRVRFSPDGRHRCTCPWWGKHQGGRGPCKHVLAAELARRGPDGRMPRPTVRGAGHPGTGATSRD
jgi:hypothetical protein